jgi:hypothetical protein
VALLASIGGGIRGLIGWGDRRASLRDAKLARWEESLVARERNYRVTMETELDELKRDLAVLRGELQTTRSVVVEVTTELRHHAPDSEALKRAEMLMHNAFPLDARVPAEQVALAGRLEKDA